MIIGEPSASYGKDAYYFSHDSNARNDQKCLKLRRVLGMEGYGIFWVLVEMLRDSTDYKLPLASIPDIAYETRVSEEKILAVINQFDLFEVQDGAFFSLRLIRSMELMQIKSDKYRKNALKRWNNATAMQSHSDGNALKERKGKERKGKEIEMWQNWADSISAGDDPVWDQMRCKKTKKEIDAFLSVAVRNKWNIETQQEFRMALKGFSLIGNDRQMANPGKLQ